MRQILFLLTVCFFAAASFAQTNIKISDLYTPVAPGLVLMDKAPSSIEKPATPRAFGVSLLNLWQGGAVNATPFWFTNKPNLTFEEFMKRKMPVIETFNISLASVRTDTSTALSAGFRTHLLRSYSKKRLEDFKRVKNDLVLLLAVEPEDLDTIAIAKKAKELADLKKRGFISVELAGAIAGKSKDNTYTSLSAKRSGFWANIRWMPEKSNLDFVALVRYLWNVNSRTKSGRDSAFFDYGVSFSYQSSHFDIAFEYVNRNDYSLKKNYDRFSLNANYMLNENMIIELALGKNFGKLDNIISIFGVKFALSGKQLKAF